MQDVNYLAEIFTSTSMWGFLGPAIMVTIVYLFTKKDKGLGIIWYIVSCLMALTFYIDLANANAWFNWHIIILILGGFMAFVLEAIK